MKAAGRIVAGVFGTIQFGGGDDFERNAVLSGKGDGVGKLGAGQARRVGDDGQHVGSDASGDAAHARYAESTPPE